MIKIFELAVLFELISSTQLKIVIIRGKVDNIAKLWKRYDARRIRMCSEQRRQTCNKHTYYFYYCINNYINKDIIKNN